MPPTPRSSSTSGVTLSGSMPIEESRSARTGSIWVARRWTGTIGRAGVVVGNEDGKAGPSPSTRARSSPVEMRPSKASSSRGDPTTGILPVCSRTTRLGRGLATGSSGVSGAGDGVAVPTAGDGAARRFPT